MEGRVSGAVIQAGKDKKVFNKNLAVSSHTKTLERSQTTVIKFRHEV